MRDSDIEGVVALQRACFPEPFPAELLWTAEHLARHLEVCPAGQLVVVEGSSVLASASAAIVSEEVWQRHDPWHETLGGHFLTKHDAFGTTLYGVDISVHPDHRRKGLARALYLARFELVRSLGLRRFGTGCRLPDFASWAAERGKADLGHYLTLVTEGTLVDRTLTPLSRLGLRLVGGIENYMDDAESLNCAALLEWLP